MINIGIGALVLAVLLCALLGFAAALSGASDSILESCFQRMDQATEGRRAEFRAEFASLMGAVGDNATLLEITEAFLGMKFKEFRETVHKVGFGEMEARSGPREGTQTGRGTDNTEILPGRQPRSSDNVGSGDCEILLELYDATGGAKWLNRTGWEDRMKFKSNCCGAYGVTCDEESRVIELNIPSNNVHGPIPRSIGGLSHLRKMCAVFLESGSLSQWYLQYLHLFRTS